METRVLYRLCKFSVTELHPQSPILFIPIFKGRNRTREGDNLTQLTKLESELGEASMKGNPGIGIQGSVTQNPCKGTGGEDPHPSFQVGKEQGCPEYSLQNSLLVPWYFIIVYRFWSKVYPSIPH
jgi:hypothetical protein